MLKRAYELAQAGDPMGAAKECEAEYRRDQSLVSAVEGVDFFVVSGAWEEALRFADLVDERLKFFRARVAFFRSLALWDAGRARDAESCLSQAWDLGYDNLERFRMEWGKRVGTEELERLLSK